MARERILIAVKTYPTLSTTYIELVRTAGFREDGSWIRIYPSPFRFLERDKQYGKYHWVEMDLKKNTKDPRPESYSPTNIDEIQVLEKVPTDRNWEARSRLILDRNTIYTNLDMINQGAKHNDFSLAIFKPTEILDLVAERCEPEWELTRKEAAQAALRQGSLFDDTDHSDFELVRKLPWKFSYRFRDDTGKITRMMIEDWEIGQLYWNCLKKSNETTAVEKVRAKYLDDFARTKDLYLFLGTTYQQHVRRLDNPYVIIGTFHPPYAPQQSLF
ncbi:hypothetical protein [Microbulbifer rhizosphaerae]|uniref:Uncharacterized protein n=1 Tax=Microbulbifer rhizosphaerae TaxID=1562603 RepID=A0A7W4Z9S3_9GAMM|nr:hypothetical protein [Microbulbifer rhizosphaerae]MBB3060505.1 hypothetical protein [Microbulbifer rhizosphaerae]